MLLLSLFAYISFAQGPGRGISKSTYSASDTTVPYNFFMKYLPVECADDSCPDNTCTCGTQGRVALKTGIISDNGTLGVSPGFGIHTVNAYGKDHSRSKASGALTVADIEAIFDDRIGDFSTFTPWTDYNTGLYTKSLDSYISAFTKDSVPFKLYSYKYKGTSYYSLLVHVKTTQVVLELISPNKPSTSVDIESTEEVRHAMLTTPSVVGTHMSPLKVSRATSNMTAIVDYYKAVFGIKPVFEQNLSDGTLIKCFELNSQATVQIRFVQRPPTKNAQNIEWFENYLNAVHDTYMTSYNSCWDIWGDNHYCFDSMNLDVDSIISLYDKVGWKYHLFEMGGGGSSGASYNGYFVDPTGWQIQLDGNINYPPANVDSFSPDYCSTSCESITNPFVQL